MRFARSWLLYVSHVLLGVSCWGLLKHDSGARAPVSISHGVIHAAGAGTSRAVLGIVVCGWTFVRLFIRTVGDFGIRQVGSGEAFSFQAVVGGFGLSSVVL